MKKTESIPTNEASAERFPSEEEVLEQFDDLIEREYTIIDRRVDEDGPYFLQAETTDADGDRMHYNYMRSGRYGKIFSDETVIDVLFFVGDTPCSGRRCKVYGENGWADV